MKKDASLELPQTVCDELMRRIRLRLIKEVWIDGLKFDVRAVREMSGVNEYEEWALVLDSNQDEVWLRRDPDFGVVWASHMMPDALVPGANLRTTLKPTVPEMVPRIWSPVSMTSFDFN